MASTNSASNRYSFAVDLLGPGFGSWRLRSCFFWCLFSAWYGGVADRGLDFQATLSHERNGTNQQ